MRGSENKVTDNVHNTIDELGAEVYKEACHRES